MGLVVVVVGVVSSIGAESEVAWVEGSVGIWGATNVRQRSADDAGSVDEAGLRSGQAHSEQADNEEELKGREDKTILVPPQAHHNFFLKLTIAFMVIVIWVVVMT